MRKVTGKKYFNAIYNYEQLVGHSYGSGVYRPTGVSENRREESLFTLYYNPATTEDNSSFFGDMWYGFSHIDDSWNLFHKKRIQTNLTSAENELADINDNIEKLKGVQEYIDNIDEYKKLGEERTELMNKMTSALPLGYSDEFLDPQLKELKKSTIQLIDSIDKRSTELYDKILKALEYYKTEGKTSDMLVDLFFDPDLASMDASEVAWTAGLKSYKSGFTDVLGALSETVDNIGSLWKAGEYGLSNLFHKIGIDWGTHPEGKFTKDFIRQTEPNNRITDKWFKDNLRLGETDKLQQNVESWWKYYHDQKSELEDDVKDYLADLQKGTWYFDPKSIDPYFEKKQESRNYGILGFLNPANLPYSFAELGSSFGSFQNMFMNIAVDAAARRLATFVATKANPYVGIVSSLVEAKKFGEAAKATHKLQQFANNAHFLGGAVSTGSSIYFTSQMRRWESNAEGMDAYSSRVLNESMNKGVNLNKVYANIDDYLGNIGISTDGLTDINKIQLALAYNAPSGDETFEGIKKESRKGLARLINENNALAFMDYIEILPFMNYTKSFLRGFGNRAYRTPIRNPFKKATAAPPPVDYLTLFRSPFKAATAEQLPINLRSNQFAQEWINGNKALREAVDPHISAFVNHQVDKALKKYIKNPKNQLRLSHGSKFFTKKAAALFPLYEKERIEEGQQHLLQQRYGRGEYDDYNKSESMFDLPSLINTAGLAADAVAGYWGLNFGDPENDSEELQRAMDIGGMTALWFRAPHVLTNLASNKLNEKLSKYTADILGDTQHENVRNLFAQFKADKAVAKIVGDHYGKMEDDEHVGIFFDSITKAKVNVDKLHESLDDFKKFKGLGVTDDFIERDEQLLNATWNLYNSPVTNAFIEYKGIKKDSEEHKKDIQLAVRNIMDSQSSNQIANEDAQIYKEQLAAFEEKALLLLNMTDVESTVNDSDKKLYDIVLGIKRTFEEHKDAQIKAFNRWAKTEEAKKTAIQSLLEQEVEGEDVIEQEVDGKHEIFDREYSLKQVSDEINRIGSERFELESSTEEAIKKVILNVVTYETFKAADLITKIFKNQDEFIKLVNTEFGKDILADQLLGMIHYMNYKLSSARDAVEQNKAIQNAVREAELKEGEDLLEVTDEQILNPYEIELPKEFRNAILNSLINGSINTVLNAAANAYITGQADPNFLRLTQRRPSWKQLTRDQKKNYIDSYKELTKKEEVSEDEVAAAYNKERRDYYKEMDVLRKEYTDLLKSKELNKKNKEKLEEIERGLEEIEKKAANMFMEAQLITKIDRLKIAHDEYLNNRPVTYDDLSAAAEGNVEAQKKIENTPKEEEPEKKEEKPGTLELAEKKVEALEANVSSTMSDDEKYLRRQFGMDEDDDSPYLPGVKEDGRYEPGISKEETDRYSEMNSKVDVDDSFNANEPISSEQLDGTYTGADKSKNKLYTSSKDEIEFNYVDQTFFFNNTAENPPYLKVNGKPVKLLDGATLHSGKELAQKLLEDGWFYRTKKYYIITGDTETERTEDQLTVCMIILDGQTAYATFLKRPFEKDNRVSWSESKTTLSEKLRYLNVPSLYLGASEEATALRNAAFKKALEAIYRRENPSQVIPDTEAEKWKLLNNWYANTSQENRDDVSDNWRKAVSGDAPIHTERHITNQIEELRSARKEIIDACVSRDNDGKYVLLTEGYKFVEPLYSDISNGQITVEYEENGKDHKYRKLTDGGFGMSSDVVELSHQLEKDEVKIGVGQGESVDDKEYAYTIVHVDRSKTGSWDPHIGKGYAGKIYCFKKASNGNLVPVMLPESRFKQEYDELARLKFGDDYDPGYEVTPDMIDEAIDEKGNIIEGKIPTVAELVFRLLTRSFNISLFGKNTDERLYDELLNLIVHNGEDTGVDTDYKGEDHYNRKLLWFDERQQLHIALPSTVTGKWLLTKIPRSYFFEENSRSTATPEQNRKRVIAAIATNMHWNTDRDSMTEDMYTGYTALFNYLKKQFKQDPSKKEFSIFGIKDLTFNRDELFDENFKPRRFSHLAWMFTNGKIKTDAVSTVFKDPFVFSRGVKPASESEQARYKAEVAKRNVELLEVKNKKEELKKEEKPKDRTERKKNKALKEAENNITELQNQSSEEDKNTSLFTIALDNIISRVKKYSGLPSNKLKKHLEEMFGMAKDEARKMLDEAGFEDAAILDVPVFYSQSDHTSDEDLRKGMDAAIARYVESYNSSHELKIKVEDFKYDIREGANQSPIWRSQDLPIIGVKKDGSKMIAFVPATAIMNYGKRSTEAGRHPVTLTGAYSNKRGIFGRVNDEAARKFVSDMLGLTDDQVIITNAVLKSFTNKRVYGVTQVAADIINGEARVQFILSKNANRGVYFHEAFHYVNLLLHTKEQRLNIYNTYRREHFFRKNWSDKRIEEDLAEKCRRYCLMRTERGLLPSIKRLFSNFLDFAFQYRKTSLMRTIYDAMLAGKYKGAQMDEESLKEFEQEYNNKAFMYVPNLRKDVADNFKAIKTEWEFYECAESLALCYTHFVLNTTIEDTMAGVNNSFDRFLKDLDLRTSFDRSPYVQDILDNPVAFKYVILGVLQKYGIKGKTKSLKKYQQQLTAEKASESTEQREAEDRYENTWDIDHFELSVKDNVAYRAKLFLSQIPNKRMEDGEFVSVVDDLLGLETYIPFDEVYESVLKELSNCSTFEQIKSECSRLGKTSNLFKSLYEQLEFISGDVQLERQLASTIKKQTPQIAFALLSEKKQKSWLKDTLTDMLSDTSSTSMDDSKTSKKAKVLNDRDKQIDINNDNAIRPLLTALREWSQRAFASNLFTYSKKLKKTYVSEDIEELLDLRLKISSALKIKPEKVSTLELQNTVDKVKENLLKLLNGLSIPYDQESLDTYIESVLRTMQDDEKASNDADSADEYNRNATLDEFKALKLAFINRKTSGSLFFILDRLEDAYNSDSDELTHNKWSEGRPFDTLFLRYSMDSLISKLAQAYLVVHPSLAEHSVKIPGGRTIYPTNENNAASDRVRWVNEDYEGFIDKMLQTPYARHSIMLNLAKELRDSKRNLDMLFVLNLFVGMKDEIENKDEDYFGITPMEDTISKMLMINGRYDADSKEFKDGGMFVLPTMADKKTFYGLQLISRSYDSEALLKRFKMPHDILTYDQDSEDGRVHARRFSKSTLDIFVGYFLDEIQSLELYYNRENIKAVVEDPNRLKVNFHGNVQNGRMDFSGNGGLFRYFYDLALQKDEAGNTYNLNLALEAAYLRLKNAEDPYFGEGVWWLREGDNELDGFELVRRTLLEIKDLYLDGEDATDRLYDDINDMLFRAVDHNMRKYAESDDAKLLSAVTTETAGKGTKLVYVPRAIPRQLLNQYKIAFKEAGLKYGSSNPYRCDTDGHVGDLSLSVIGNYVVGQIISIIEVEKLMSGDPATYKYKYNKVKTPIIVDGQLVESSILKEKDTDKIKRLGMVLSPGQEMDFTGIDYEKYPELKSKEYTVANIKDVQAKSIYLNEMRSIIGSLILADAVRKDPKIVFGELTVTKEQKQEYIDKLYEDYDFYQLELQKLPQKIKSNILSETEKGIAPYNYDNITVADAEVLIRPALYRKIRIGLGDWNIDHKIPIKYRDLNGKVQTTYYTDDIAYNIVEEDGSWQSDPEKAAIVRNLELYPLKMSYSQNDPHEISLNNVVAQDIYDKMAIFPAFKFMFRSKTGQLLYNRMNMENNELDMIAFESAVKVGCDKNMWSPYKKGTESLASMNDIMSMKSSNYIDKDGAVHHNSFDKNVMPVTIQSLDNLRMQLNTEHHEDTERSLGTQMFKILFSNIYDDENYCVDTEKERSGKKIRLDIMDCVNALTIKGLNNIKKQFYTENGTAVDKEKVRNWVKRVLESNQVGANAEEIINNGGSVASLLSRKLVEQSMSALTNSEIVDILTNGGSAVQQSMFGFVSYDADTLIEYLLKLEKEYSVLNNGHDVRWLREDGTMEVMLSANFFRSVVPKKFQKTPDMMREWLVEHDIIKGAKKIKNPVLQRLELKIDSEEYTSSPNLSVTTEAIFDKLHVVTFGDIISKKQQIEKLLKNVGEFSLMKEIEHLLNINELSFDTKTPEDEYIYVENNPKPFGMGYRIPTLGLSSTFAFVVADIIPEVAGDVIIVPKEFTAQTGSDFDVDKIFLSTFSYDKNGLLYTTDLEGEALVNAKSGAIRNKLLLNYIDIATDKKSLANARGSIDVFTDIIKDEILPMIRPDYYQYPPSFYELTPYFLSQRKKEFSTGKDGIGPFALNITNLALTLFSHLTFNYDADNNTTGFRFRDLDEVTGDDGRRISDWLSAMVNAHVDVAKDPYIFDLNVNKATYNHVNFLLRAGKGKMTFLFIAQKALKEYATRANSAGGMYGGRIDNQNVKKAKWQILEDMILEYTQKVQNKFEHTTFKDDEEKQQWADVIKKMMEGDVEWHTIFEEKEEPIKTSRGTYKSNAEYALKNPNTLRGLLFLLLCLLAYKQMNPYAEALANLVRVSKIDTKKFGNDIVKHINFLNSLNNFMYGEDANMWTLSPRADLKAILENDKDGGKVYYSSVKYTRNAVEKDKNSLYIFTDNASRTSGSKKIDPESRYSKKYGKGKKYPADTSAVVRGLDNAMPVTTVKLYDPKLGIEEKRWHNSDFEEFKEIIDDEFDAIIEEWKTGKYKRIILPSKDGFFDSWIADIREFGDRSEMYSYLHDKMDQLLEAVGHLGKINSANGKNIALNHYFDSSFLSTKLFAATGIMAELLKGTTYSATDAFELLFTTFMAEIFGDRRFEIGDKMIDGYKDIFNDDVVTAIGTATENIIRTQMLFLYGLGVTFNDGVNRQDPNFNWAENEKKNGYTGEIDFTFGGDIEEARRLIKRLFFGRNKSEDPYEKKSIFANINDLIRDIKKDPLAEEYSGLTDGEGKIYGILDYLRPVPKSDSFPMERMTFKKSRVITTVDERQKLSSSFGLLLNHPNSRVRRVARDIALFAYYSTYDTNIGSSFFDLVPFDFRKQYDAALVEGLKNQNLLMDQLDPTSMLAIICRNYYYDHNIVPVYHLSINNENVYPEQRERKTGRQKQGEYKAPVIIDYDNNDAKVTPLVITRQTNAKFITIKQDGIDYLYEKTNAIEIYSKSSGIVSDTWNTYVLTPKLGRHHRNIHQYEFLSDGSIRSVFDENNLPDDFDYEDIADWIDEFMEEAEKNLNKREHNNRSVRIRSTKNTVVSTNLLVNDLYRRMDRNVKIDDSNIIKSDKKASDFSDFDIDLSKSVEEIVDEVRAEVSDKNSISISLSGIPKVNVTKEMVDKFIEEQALLYLSRLNISLPIKMRNETISKYKEEVKEVAEAMVRKRLYEDYTINILFALHDADISVNDVYLNFDDAQKSVYRALIKYYRNNFNDDLDHVHVVDNNASQEDLTNAASDEQLVLSQDEDVLAEALKQFIDDTNDATQLIIEQAQLKKEDETETLENAVKNDDPGDDLMRSDDPALDNMSIDDLLNSAEEFNNNKEAEACMKGGNNVNMS